MKKIIYKSIIFTWNQFPLKFILKYFFQLSPYLKNKLYQDLRYKGMMELSIRNKKFKMFNPGYTTIENELYWNGIENGWEKQSLEIWQHLCVNSSTILDIGANTGIYSFVANAINPKAQIFAFEPVKRTAAIFKKNLLLNKSNNIKLYEAAVSNSSGKATFYDVDSKSQYSATLNKEMLCSVDNKVEYEVDIIQLDSCLEIFNNNIDLIKIDVEMHEPEAIEGMIGIIQRDKPSLLIEILNDEIAEKLSGYFQNLGYQYYLIDEINPPVKITKIKASSFHNVLFIQPEIAAELNL
jgi:FkbM family methyltransferase